MICSGGIAVIIFIMFTIHSPSAAIGAARHWVISTVMRDPRNGRAANTARSPKPIPMTPLAKNQATLALENPLPRVCANDASTTVATTRRPRLALAEPNVRRLRFAHVALSAKKNAARNEAIIGGCRPKRGGFPNATVFCGASLQLHSTFADIHESQESQSQT